MLRVPVLGITGGIATGKSSFTEALRPFLDAEVFDADRCARELVANDANVRRSIGETFGNAVFDANGELDRARLRQIVFHDETKRRELEAILHPIIRKRWTDLAEKAGNHWLIVDIPLLFETKTESLFDAIVVVACSPATQCERLVKMRSLTLEIAAKMIASQSPLKLKIELAGHVIWSEVIPAYLDQQAALLAACLKKRYG